MADKPAKKSTYDASAIQVLEGLEPVRKRPGMYIGTTGPDGLHHLINEIFDNSRDEAMGGYADRVEVATDVERGDANEPWPLGPAIHDDIRRVESAAIDVGDRRRAQPLIGASRSAGERRNETEQ